MNLKNILVAIDFSRYSDAALEYATSLARDSQAKLHIVHVKEPFHVYEADTKYADVFPYADIDSLKGALERIRPTDHDVVCRHWLIAGDAVQGLVDLANDEKCDLIVMGTHGRRGVSRLLMGSVAEGVLRQANCPVLTVKQRKLAKVKENQVTST